MQQIFCICLIIFYFSIILFIFLKKNGPCVALAKGNKQNTHLPLVLLLFISKICYNLENSLPATLDLLV